ncbi:TPA: hypothetical protein PXF58_002565, partial [Mannheimia haemolytica]|nr:hypothetical protein [Mannheimia haemolytica]
QDKNHFNDKALLKNYPDSLKSALVLAEWTKEYHGKYDNFINDIKSDNWTSAAINFHLGMEKVPLNDLIYKEIYNYWDKTSLKDESERIISASIEFSNYFANKYSENIEEGIKNAEKEFKKNYNKSLRYNAKKAQQRVQKYVEKVNQKNPQALKDLDNISNLKKINENLKKAAKFTGIISSIKDYYDLAEGFRNGIKSNDWEPFLKTSAQIGASALMSMLVASMITGPTTIGSIIISAAFISIGGYIISLASR